jgi:hypothetical protein
MARNRVPRAERGASAGVAGAADDRTSPAYVTLCVRQRVRPAARWGHRMARPIGALSPQDYCPPRPATIGRWQLTIRDDTVP